MMATNASFPPLTIPPLENGDKVQEYLVWRVYDSQFDWFRLNNGEYVQLEPNQQGLLCSQVFIGLWLDKGALLAGNMKKVLAILQQGLSTREQ